MLRAPPIMWSARLGYQAKIIGLGIALLCTACASPQQNVLLSAYGQPAGYYAGRAEPLGGRGPDWEAWVSKNREGIDDIQRRILEIREGKRTPGCIGEDTYTCVATLAQKQAIADVYFLKDSNVFAEIKNDVNGKPVNGSRITFEGYIPNATGDSIRDRTSFDLTLGRDGKVILIKANLPKDPMFAKTQDEYDATGIYETVSALTAKKCPALSKAEVARWIENTVKPSSRFGPHEVSTGTDLSIATHRASRKIAFCGRIFEFHSIWGNSVNLTDTTNPQGIFGGMTVEVR